MAVLGPEQEWKKAPPVPQSAPAAPRGAPPPRRVPGSQGYARKLLAQQQANQAIEDQAMRDAIRNKVVRSQGVNYSSNGTIPSSVLNQLGLGIPVQNQQGFAVGIDPRSMSPQETEWLRALAQRAADGTEQPAAPLSNMYAMSEGR